MPDPKSGAFPLGDAPVSVVAGGPPGNLPVPLRPRAFRPSPTPACLAPRASDCEGDSQVTVQNESRRCISSISSSVLSGAFGEPAAPSPATGADAPSGGTTRTGNDTPPPGAAGDAAAGAE